MILEIEPADFVSTRKTLLDNFTRAVMCAGEVLVNNTHTRSYRRTQTHSSCHTLTQLFSGTHIRFPQNARAQQRRALIFVKQREQLTPTPQ